MPHESQIESAARSDLSAVMRDLKMLQITMGTGIAGAVIENGRPLPHLCEPGKAVLNLVPSGDFDFPSGLAANNQIAKAALERAFRILFDLPKTQDVDLRNVAEIGQGRLLSPTNLPGLTLPTDAVDRATEVFRILGRGMADLVIALLPHVEFNAFGLAGGPLRGMPDVVLKEISDRCERYGYSLIRIAPRVAVFRIKKSIPLSSGGPLGRELQAVIESAGHYSADLLSKLIGHVEESMPLSQNAEVRETEGRYVPIAAYRLIMNLLADYFPDSGRFTVDFDGIPFSTITVPDEWKPSDAIDEFIAKYPCALVTNQAMTAGFDQCNYLDASSIASTTASLNLSAGYQYVLQGAHFATGLGVISGCYYSTWKDVFNQVAAKSRPATTPTAASSICNNLAGQLAIGIDIGGTGIKTVLLSRGSPSDAWEVCTHPTDVKWPAAVHSADVAGDPAITTSNSPLDEYSTESAIQPPDANIDDSAVKIIARAQAFAWQAAPNAQVTRVGIVFPAAVAENAAVAAPSRIAGAFDGQTPLIINAHAAQLLKLNVIQAFRNAWKNSGHADTPNFVLANDGVASSVGAYNAVLGLPDGVHTIVAPEGAYGAIGVTQI